MHMDEPPVECSDPQTAIVVAEKSVGIDGRRASLRVQLRLSIEELSHSARHGNDQFSRVTDTQIIELRTRYRIVPRGAGPPSPKPGLRTGPDITGSVLKQRQDCSAECTVLPVGLHTAVSYGAEPAGGSAQAAGPHCTFMVLKQRCHKLVIKLWIASQPGAVPTDQAGVCANPKSPIP